MAALLTSLRTLLEVQRLSSAFDSTLGALADPTQVRRIFVDIATRRELASLARELATRFALTSTKGSMIVLHNNRAESYLNQLAGVLEGASSGDVEELEASNQNNADEADDEEYLNRANAV